MAESGNGYVLRAFTHEDYARFASWWKPDAPPPPSSLPYCGMVAGDMKAVGFMADTDTDFMILTWWYANPENQPRESYKALSVIIKSGKEWARRMGKRYVFCYTGMRGMIRLLESLGFSNNDGHMVAEVL